MAQKTKKSTVTAIGQLAPFPQGITTGWLELDDVSTRIHEELPGVTERHTLPAFEHPKATEGLAVHTASNRKPTPNKPKTTTNRTPWHSGTQQGTGYRLRCEATALSRGPGPPI
jgi:hypothetical protein